MRHIRIAAALAVAVAASLLAAAPAAAQSLEVKKMRVQQEADLSTALALTNKRCGLDLKAGYDWKSFDEAEVAKKNVAPYCAAALDAIEDLCGDQLGKDALKDKVKTLSCAGAKEPGAALSEGTLTFSFSLTPNQNKLLVRSFLEKNL